MRFLTSAVVFLLLLIGTSVQASSLKAPIQDWVQIQKKSVVLIRSRKLVKDFPERRKATVNFPVITGGIDNPTVLANVRSLLNVKNIFGSSLAEYRQDTWLSDFDYSINYNKNYILDITFTQDGAAAYPDTHQKHLAINLKTGKLIKASDVFKAESLESLAEKINQKLQAEMKETVDQVNKDASIDADEKARVPELYEGLKFEVKHLQDFSIQERGMTFLFDAEFPHVVKAYQPAGQYVFTYAELAPYLKRQGAPRSLIQ